MNYDHQKRAGNRGDVIKHVALVAALDTALQQTTQGEFRYADTFAGYAYNPILVGNQWEEGVGRFRNVLDRVGVDANPHFSLWARLCFARKENNGGKYYSGSSLFAYNLCRLRNKQASLFLWDTSSLVLDDLKAAFSEKQHAIRGDVAKPQDISDMDLVLIDPPGLQSRKNPDFPNWKKDILPFLQSKASSVLLWIPLMAATNEDEARIPNICCLDALSLGCKVTKVMWETRGLGMIGCLLIYRLPSLIARKALQNAIDYVVNHSSWDSIVEPAQRAVHY